MLRVIKERNVVNVLVFIFYINWSFIDNVKFELLYLIWYNLIYKERMLIKVCIISFLWYVMIYRLVIFKWCILCFEG